MKFSAIEATQRAISKSDIDASLPESVIISADVSVRVQLAAATPVLSQLCQRIQNENTLQLSSFRLILMAGNLAEAVSPWEQALGRPQMGVSNQPEGVAVAKKITWGCTQESARSIIILTDLIAVAAIRGDSVAPTTLAHELGHVHDEFSRGVALGFPESHTVPDIRDWPKVRAYIADMAWGEYAAESVGARYMGPELLNECILNDPVHLAGVHGRLRQSICNYRFHGQDLVSLWSGGITAIGDIFANLGRASARLQFAQSPQEALNRLLAPQNGAMSWKPVIERVVHELQLLGVKRYSEWEAKPLRGIEEAVAMGFEAVGLFPTHNGSTLHVRVP